MAKKLSSFADLAALTGNPLPVTEQSAPAEGVVYSTDSGRIKSPVNKSVQSPVGNGKVRISRTSKGRGGKTVTLITGLPLLEDQLKQLCTQLKKQLGCGGAVVQGDLEFQGDKREQLLAALTKSGYNPKLSGG
jgi:translation initiation factor 1